MKVKMDKPYILIYQSGNKYDPKIGTLGREVNGKTFYARTQDKSLVFERTSTRRYNRKKEIDPDTVGTWLIALKWSSHGFRAIWIAVDRAIVPYATKTIKENLDKGYDLSLLKEYPFKLELGEVLQGDTSLSY